MSYSLNEHIESLKTGLKHATKLHELYPDATQTTLGKTFNGKPRYIWWTHELRLEDCNQFEVVQEGDLLVVAFFREIEEAGRIYPHEVGRIYLNTALERLRDNHPELYLKLLEFFRGSA